MEFGDYEPESRFGDYISLPSGPCIVELRDVKEPELVLGSVPARLETGFCFTLAVREKESKLALEVLDDSPAKDPGGELVVRSFVADLKTLQIDAGPDLHVRLTSDSPFLRVRGLPRIALQVDTSGTDVAGKPIEWSNEVDFGSIHRATVLIVADPYGRIRPRVVIDGSRSTDTTEEKTDKATKPANSSGKPGEQR